MHKYTVQPLGGDSFVIMVDNSPAVVTELKAVATAIGVEVYRQELFEVAELEGGGGIVREDDADARLLRSNEFVAEGVGTLSDLSRRPSRKKDIRKGGASLGAKRVACFRARLGGA
jgi:hypothetical protein